MGGKWTRTHRAMAEEHALNATQKYLGEAGRKCSTLTHPLLGSAGYTPDYWQTLAKRFGLTELTARHLAQKYGSCAPDVMKFTEVDPDLTRPLLAGLAPIRAEVVYGGALATSSRSLSKISSPADWLATLRLARCDPRRPCRRRTAYARTRVDGKRQAAGNNRIRRENSRPDRKSRNLRRSARRERRAQPTGHTRWTVHDSPFML